MSRGLSNIVLFQTNDDQGFERLFAQVIMQEDSGVDFDSLFLALQEHSEVAPIF